MSALPTPAGMFTAVPLKRWPAGGHYDAVGAWVEGGAPTTSTITASVQPVDLADTNELLHLAEGDRTKESVKIYTRTELKMGKEGTTGQTPDEITWLGAQWQVKRVFPNILGIAHYKAIAVRLDIQ